MPLRFQGAWRVTKLEAEGVVVDASMFSGSRITVNGNRFVTSGMGGNYEGDLVICDDTSPATIDFHFTSGPETGNINRGIFRFDSPDCWTLCLNMGKGPRPAKFQTRAGSGFALEVLERTVADLEAPSAIAPTPAEDAAPGDPLSGTWWMTSGVIDGKPLPAEFARNGKRVSADGEMTLTFGSQVWMKARYTVDRELKRVDYLIIAGPSQGQYQYGIYIYKGSTLRLCMAAPGYPRPTDFEPGPHRTVTTWSRKQL